MGYQNPLYKYFGKEDNMAMAVANYIHNQYPKQLWWHTVNEGRRTRLEQLKAISLGILSGVSDVLVISPVAGEKGLALELKYDKNTLTANQKNFLERMKASGWAVHTSWNFDDARQVLDDYILNHCNYEQLHGKIRVLAAGRK